MSSTSNPTFISQQPPAPQAITPAMIECLRQTKPWVRFLSVLGFIFTGLIVLAGIALALGAGLLRSMANTPLAGVPAVLIGVVYVGLGILYLIPNLFLFR
jgi:hypothetical protein